MLVKINQELDLICLQHSHNLRPIDVCIRFDKYFTQRGSKQGL